MTETIVFVALMMVNSWVSFYLGSRKEKDRVFEFDKKQLIPEDMDLPEEPSDDEYFKTLKEWEVNGEEAESEGR